MMSSQPFSPTRDSHRRHSSRRPSERDRDSLSDVGSLADDAGDRHHRRSRSHSRVDSDRYAVVPRRKQRSRSRRGDEHEHEHEHEDEDDGGKAVGRMVRRRRSDDSIASSCSGRTQVYDSHGRRQDDRRPRRTRSQYSGHSGRGGHHYYYDDDEDLERKRQQQPPKKRNRLDPRVILAAVFCVGAAAYCWKEASNDRRRSPRRKE